jgi:hypothetical protein
MIRKMINKIRKLLFEESNNQCLILSVLVNNYRKENQSLSGRIKTLEEQQEIMHNFLVEINNYLAKQSQLNDSVDVTVKENKMAKEMKLKKEMKKPKKEKHLDEKQDMAMLKKKVKKSCMK